MLSIQTRIIDRTRHLCLISGAAALLSASAFAQASAQMGESRSDHCQAPARQQHQHATTANGDVRSADSSKLQACNGVLKPPATGDSDLVQPAPPVGNTPVIRPEDAPQGQQ
jgi:hypothetical protein